MQKSKRGFFSRVVNDKKDPIFPAVSVETVGCIDSCKQDHIHRHKETPMQAHQLLRFPSQLDAFSNNLIYAVLLLQTCIFESTQHHETNVGNYWFYKMLSNTTQRAYSTSCSIAALACCEHKNNLFRLYTSLKCRSVPCDSEVTLKDAFSYHAQ